MKKEVFFEAVTLAGQNAAVAMFTPTNDRTFRETKDANVLQVGGVRYMPWGADDQMPYDINDIIEQDETLSRCMVHNYKNCYGTGLFYNTDAATDDVKEKVAAFQRRNTINSLFYGQCQDLKQYGFAVTLILLNREPKPRIAAITRLNAMYCRFACTQDKRPVGKLLYGNFRDSTPLRNEIEIFPILRENDPFGDLMERLYPLDGHKPTGDRAFAVITRMPTVDSTFYPIPEYASVIRGKWYDIKRLIAVSKYAKLKNAAPIKYLIEVSKDFWANKFAETGATDELTQQKIVNQVKSEIIEYLTGAENAGKALFSEYYITPDGHECHDIKITTIERNKEGGDWQTDIQEAVNMICFSMGVHSNLVGSVPGNNSTSGSDKRELYTIAQALEQPSRDMLMTPHQLVCDFNEWAGVKPQCNILQLTTLDQHKDAEEMNIK